MSTPIRLFLAAALAALAGAAGAVDLTGLRFELLTRDLDAATSITHAGDGRLFITLRAGRVVIFENGQVSPTPFLDVTGRVRSAGGEQGLLGLAFHPDYPENGYFFVHYTREDNAVVLARFEVGDGPDAADPASEKELLVVAQPTVIHNGGQLAFGPDGFLYVALGDGGGANDPSCRGQDRSSLLGKLLRLDVDAGPGQPPYHAPAAGNPFVGPLEGRDEIWAYGLRNPWRFSFDRETGDLYVGDVGQGLREEVNFQPAASPGGENYGWKVMEGSLCTNSTQGCGFPVPACGSPEFTAPIASYSHAQGCAVIGGYVYRGAAIPQLRGAYLFGDFCAGTIVAAERVGAAWQLQSFEQAFPGLRSFGEDAAGEVYLATGTTLYRLVDQGQSGCRPDETTLCLRQGRFEMRASWRTAGGQGAARAVQILGDAGYFWFFGENNPELFVKVLNGCFDPFDTFWVFAAGLTEVGVTLTVRDTQAGSVKVYESPLGTAFAPIRDTRAFATCP